MTNDERKIREITGGFVAGKLYERISYKEIEHSNSNNIFDDESYNFHIYPEESLQSLKREISNEIKKKREDVIEALCNLKLSNVNIEIDSNRLNNNNMETDTIYITKGEGSRGGNGELGGLFKYIAATKNGIKYEMNFMRFFVNVLDIEVKEVNCILRALQFDRCIGEYVNKSEKGCDVCYPNCFRSQSDEELEKVLKSRIGKSFCYNPQCDFNDTAEKIAKEFIKFINLSDVYGKRNYIVKKEILNKKSDNRYYLRLDRESGCLEVYEKKDHRSIGNSYPIRQNFDTSEYVFYELEKTMSCIIGGIGRQQTPTGIFNVEKVSSSEYISSYHPKFDKVKFFGYIVVFEDYFIHSDMYLTDATLDNFHKKKSISMDDKYTSGCIRVLQEDLNWLVENITEGTIIEM